MHHDKATYYLGMSKVEKENVLHVSNMVIDYNSRYCMVDSEILEAGTFVSDVRHHIQPD